MTQADSVAMREALTFDDVLLEPGYSEEIGRAHV